MNKSLMRSFGVAVAVLAVFCVWPNVVGATQKVEGDVFTLTSSASKSNGKWMVSLQVVPKKNLHINREYPWKVKVLEAKGAILSKSTYTVNDATVFSDQLALFNIVVDAKETTVVKFQVRFSLCDDKQCFMKRLPVTMELKAPN